MKVKLTLEGAMVKWCYWILFIFLLLLCLSPLVMAVIFSIFFTPWCLFILTSYLFFGPIFILAIHDCWELLRSF